MVAEEAADGEGTDEDEGDDGLEDVGREMAVSSLPIVLYPASFETPC